MVFGALGLKSTGSTEQRRSPRTEPGGEGGLLSRRHGEAWKSERSEFEKERALTWIRCCGKCPSSGQQGTHWLLGPVQPE